MVVDGFFVMVFNSCLVLFDGFCWFCMGFDGFYCVFSLFFLMMYDGS